MNHTSISCQQPFRKVYRPGPVPAWPAGVTGVVEFSIQPLESALSAAAFLQHGAIDPSGITLFVFTQGAGTIHIDLQECSVREGTVLIAYPGAAIRTGMQAEGRGYCISFTPDLFRGADITIAPLLSRVLHHHYKGALMLHADDGILEAILPVARSMQQEYMTYDKGCREIFRGLLMILMTYLSRSMDHVPGSFFHDRSITLMERFMSLIRKHSYVHKQVAAYAAMLCVTPGFLNSVLKRSTGHTASYHIYRHLLLEAKKKAVFTTDSMKDIAMAMGFTDVYHFSKFFSKNAGMNFSSFRKEPRCAGYDHAGL